jgi:hypothetical protein
MRMYRTLPTVSMVASAAVAAAALCGVGSAQADTFRINAVANGSTIAASSLSAPDWGDPDDSGCVLLDVGNGRVIGSADRPEDNLSRIYIQSVPLSPGRYTVAIRCYTGHYSASVVSNRVSVNVSGGPASPFDSSAAVHGTKARPKTAKPGQHRQGEHCTTAGRQGVWVVDDSQPKHRWVCDADDGLPVFKPNAHKKGAPCTSRGRTGGWKPIDTNHGWEWVCYTDR